MLQADSKEMFDIWISALQKGIGAAIQRIHGDINNHDIRRDSSTSTTSHSSGNDSSSSVLNKSNDNKHSKYVNLY